MSLGVEVRTSLGRDAPAWDRLVDRTANPSPFLRSWWLDALAPDGEYVLVRNGEEVVGGVALQRDSRSGIERLRFAGDGPLSPDHLDMISAPDASGEVAEAFRRWASRPGARLLDLRSLDPDSLLARSLPNARDEAFDVAPYAALTDWDTYLRARSSKLRNTVDRTRRRLERAGVAYSRRESLADVEEALEDLRRLHESRWASSTPFLESFDLFADAARGAARCREVVFHELRGDEGPIAILVNFRVAGRESFYQSGRRTEHEWRGAGTVLHACAIERACASETHEYDFLRGDEPYKRDWSTGVRVLRRLLFGRGARARLYLRARSIRGAIGRRR